MFVPTTDRDMPKQMIYHAGSIAPGNPVIGQNECDWISIIAVGGFGFEYHRRRRVREPQDLVG
jgi:hypothetical protein